MMVIGFLIVVALIFLIIGQIKNAEIILSPIVGIMFGFLYHKEQFEEENEIDLAYSVDELSRFRVNIYRQRGTIAITLRVVPLKVKAFEELNLPVDVLKRLASEPRGLILITGVTGAGKTTTINAMLDYINENFQYNIITIEN